MAFQLGNVPNDESLHLVLTIVGAGCTLLFATVGWLLRMAVNRALGEIAQLKDERIEQIRFNEWVKGVLAAAKITPRPVPPEGD